MATTKKEKEKDNNNVEEWIFSFDKTTGELLKVEKFDEKGARQEISEEEYASLSPMATTEELGDVESEYEAGYYQALADLEGEPMSAEEAAYYQGMADYEESLNE